MSDIGRDLARIASSASGVEEGVACAGTALESRTFKLGGKAFLFLNEKHARLKLEGSLPEATRLAASSPGIAVGARGWVRIDLRPDSSPPRAVLERWIAEGRTLVGGGAASAPKTSRARGTKKASRPRKTK